MPLNQPLKMNLDLVCRLLGQDIEIVNKTGTSRIAVAEGVPIYLDKATKNVGLEYLSGLGGINLVLDGIDAYQFLANTLNFANVAKFIQNLAGLKDASGTKRIVVVKPGDDLKSAIENSTAGQVIILMSGSHTIDQQISWPNHRLHFLGIGDPAVVFDFSSSQPITTVEYPTGTEGTTFQNIRFTTTSISYAFFKVKNWIWDNVRFEDYASPGNCYNCVFSKVIFAPATYHYPGGGTFIECYQTSGRIEIKYTATLIGGEFTSVRLVDFDNIKVVGGKHRQIRFHGWASQSGRNRVAVIDGVHFTGSVTPIFCESSGRVKKILVKNCSVVMDGTVFQNASSNITIDDLVFLDNYLAASSSGLSILSNSGTIHRCVAVCNSGDATFDTSQATNCEFDMNTGIAIS